MSVAAGTAAARSVLCAEGPSLKQHGACLAAWRDGCCVVSQGQRVTLERLWAHSMVEPHRRVLQARGLLLAADGVTNEEIEGQRATKRDKTRRWRSRVVEACV